MSLPRQVVVLRGASCARMPEGEEIVFDRFPSTAGPVKCTFRTRLVNEGFEVLVPRGIYAQVEANAPTLDEAIIAALNTTMALKPLISLSANASVQELEAEIAFDATEGRPDHEYVQNFLPASLGPIQPARRVATAPTIAFVKTVILHPRIDRLLRAIVHYDSALRYWRPEFSVLALSHLWIATEALTQVAKEKAKADEGVPDESALALKWGIDKKKLDSEIRARIIFHGDLETCKAAVRASDAYEHSFKDFQAIWETATKIRETTAQHVRTSIFDLAGTPGDVRDALLSAPFDKPFESVPLVRKIRGVLHGATDQLSAADQMFPFLKWQSKLVTVSRDAAGLYGLRTTDDFTPVIGPGVLFTARRIEWWGPKLDPPAPQEPQELKLSDVLVTSNQEKPSNGAKE